MIHSTSTQKMIVINEKNIHEALAIRQIVDWIVGYGCSRRMRICVYNDGMQEILVGDGKAEGFTTWSPTKYWEQGGPIIESEKIWVWYNHDIDLWLAQHKSSMYYASSKELLLAAMRTYCYIVVKQAKREEIEIPAELWPVSVHN